MKCVNCLIEFFNCQKHFTVFCLCICKGKKKLESWGCIKFSWKDKLDSLGTHGGTAA